MKTKTNQIKAALAVGNKKKALSIASKFFDRSEDTALFKQAKSAEENPSFYRQIGKDPEAIIEAAMMVINKRFGDGS